MLEGLLVDLVPLGDPYGKLEHTWENGPAAFWGDMGDRQFFSRAAIKRHQEERLERRHEQGDTDVMFGIQAKDGTPIGAFFIGWIVPSNRTGILGAYLGDPAYWGGGYGTDALLLTVDYAFDWLDLRRVWLMTMSLNERVMRQMAKVGFTLEAQRRQATLADGEWHDVLNYGMLRDEWPGYAAMIDKLGLRARG